MNHVRSNLVLDLLAFLAANIIIPVVVVNWPNFLRIAPELRAKSGPV